MQPQVALDTLRRAFRWMHRIRHRRGYGVQSPYAFSLVHDVIYETAPYYAYAALDAAARLANWRTRDARLVFRLFNAFAPKRGALLFPSPAPHGDGRVVKEAATLACPSAEWRCGEDAFSQSTEGALDVVYAETPQLLFAQWPAALTAAAPCCAFIVRGIHATPQARGAWQAITRDERVRLTFDLYDIGVLCLEPRFAKQHYVVNWW